MPAIKHVLVVKPSQQHQRVLLAGHLLVTALLWFWLQGLYWYGFLFGALLSLGYSLHLARQRSFTLELQVGNVTWQGERYTLGSASRVGYGFLWLVLEGPQATALCLFSDSLGQADYRRLARLITLLH